MWGSPPSGEDVVAEEDGVDQEDRWKHRDPRHKPGHADVRNSKVDKYLMFRTMQRKTGWSSMMSLRNLLQELVDTSESIFKIVFLLFGFGFTCSSWQQCRCWCSCGSGSRWQWSWSGNQRWSLCPRWRFSYITRCDSGLISELIWCSWGSSGRQRRKNWRAGGAGEKQEGRAMSSCDFLPFLSGFVFYNSFFLTGIEPWFFVILICNRICRKLIFFSNGLDWKGLP